MIRFPALVLFALCLSPSAVGLRAAEPSSATYTISIPKGISVIANHLNRGSNTVGELWPDAIEETLLYKFDADRQIHTVNEVTYFTGFWNRPDETIAPGEGVMVKASFPDSVTFSGTAPTNTALPTLVGGYNWVSFPSAEVQEWPAPLEGDAIHRWHGTFHTKYSYESAETGWVPSLPIINKGETFVYYRAAPPSTNAVKDGTIYFSTYIPGEVHASWALGDGGGPGAGWKAELVRLAPDGTITPLLPQTTFYTNNSFGEHYVKPVVVTVPGTSPGDEVTVLMRIFHGDGFSHPFLRGWGAPVTLTLGGGGLTLPANLFGMTGAQLLESRPPIISEQPQSVTTALGGDAQLRVTISSPAPWLRYQWEKDGALLAGETNNVLDLRNVKPSDAGIYRVRLGYVNRDLSYSARATVSLLGIDLYPGLTITGPVGARYRIEYSLEAEQPTWHSLTEVTLPTSPYTFADVTAPARTKRFYRAVLIPSN